MININFIFEWEKKAMNRYYVLLYAFLPFYIQNSNWSIHVSDGSNAIDATTPMLYVHKWKENRQLFFSSYIWKSSSYHFTNVQIHLVNWIWMLLMIVEIQSATEAKMREMVHNASYLLRRTVRLNWAWSNRNISYQLILSKHGLLLAYHWMR